MSCDDGNLWIVKFRNNPQHTRVLANELIGTQIAGRIGLSVPIGGIIGVSETIINTHPALHIDLGGSRQELCLGGLQFGSQFAGDMSSRHVDEYLASEQLLHADNLDQFAGILAFDKWTCNTDYRQVVYRRNSLRRGYSAVFIDQGACFNMGDWNFPDAPLRGTFAQTCAYSSVTGWQSFEPWLSRIEEFDPHILWEIAKTVPHEWCGGKGCELDRLVDKLLDRRSRVRELISQFKDCDKRPFANWNSDTSNALPPRMPPTRSTLGATAVTTRKPCLTA